MHPPAPPQPTGLTIQMLKIRIVLCVMIVLSPHFVCISPSEEGGWEAAYRLADEAELLSTTEQKV